MKAGDVKDFDTLMAWLTEKGYTDENGLLHEEKLREDYPNFPRQIRHQILVESYP